MLLPLYPIKLVKKWQQAYTGHSCLTFILEIILITNYELVKNHKPTFRLQIAVYGTLAVLFFLFVCLFVFLRQGFSV